MEQGPKNLNEYNVPFSEPKELDVVIIDGRLGQIHVGEVAFLDELTDDGKISILHKINWHEYNYKKTRETLRVGDLRKRGKISEEEYLKIHLGPEEKTDPYIRDHVKFFGFFEKKNNLS